MHTELKKIYRIFNLISRMRSPIGCSKKDVAKDFEVSERTVERYIALLEELGFNISRDQGRHKIENMENANIRPESLFVFSAEEARFIREAVLGSYPATDFQKELINKLYALTDLEEISDTLHQQRITNNIRDIREAIVSKQRVILKNYHSVNSGDSRDRKVEPIRFIQYFAYLIAYEPESKMVKQFKTGRIGGVKVHTTRWRYEAYHEKLATDLFGMSGYKQYRVKLRLSDRAASLLEEEFPGAGQLISRNHEQYAEFNSTVYSLKGVGRFIMGLLDEIEIVKPKALKQYIDNRIENYRLGIPSSGHQQRSNPNAKKTHKHYLGTE